jgi:heterogeneous nuclear ribonucleoprotein F/H
MHSASAFAHFMLILRLPPTTYRLLNQQGLPRGEALVEFVNDGEASAALSAMNKKPIGTRWIDIVPSTAGEIRAARSYGGLVPVGQNAKEIEKFAGADYEYSSFQFGDSWVKLRGLPYSITKKDVADFLLRASVVPVGIFLSEGIGYVELQSAAQVEAVLLLHKQKIGHRWVEVFHLSRAEAMQKAPHMQMQMQMQHGYSAMQMQQASGAYMSYPYAMNPASWYPAAASPQYQSASAYSSSAAQYHHAAAYADDVQSGGALCSTAVADSAQHVLLIFIQAHLRAASSKCEGFLSPVVLKTCCERLRHR